MVGFTANYVFVAVIALSSFCFTLNATDDTSQYGDELTSRFILNSDPKIYSLAGIQLKNTWWSRPQEYAWALQFANSETTVLDAACGISHPFKWELGQISASTWALDADPRISNLESIIQETYDDLGTLAHTILTNSPDLYSNMHLVYGSIFNLPTDLPQFDRIFCISTLEHLYADERVKTLQEFAKYLKSDGLLVLTVDYPEITPKALMAAADAAGLMPAGNVILDLPEMQLTNGSLSIYRAVFKHKGTKTQRMTSRYFLN